MTADSAPEARLLVVDDEANILELLTASLRHAGFEVTPASRGTDAVRIAAREAPDLVLLDVMMPGIDGFETLRRLRSEGVRCPVLFLTARDAVEDRIAGLTLGGDEYITKPFSLGEVIARIRVVLRRSGHPPSAHDPEAHVLAFADITLDEDAHEVTKAGASVELSPTEFKLLRFLMENQGRVMSKAQILDNVWTYDVGGDGHVGESDSSDRRRKVDTTEPRLIHTVRGVGYVLRTPR
ncbi:MAG: response regulator transcription factor [bacterium]